MRKTPLKRKTSLKSKTRLKVRRGLVRKPLKKHINKDKLIPESVLEETCIRDGGTWENNKCVINVPCKFCGQRADFRGFDPSHRIHRGMGGNTKMDTVDNIDWIPRRCHDERDMRIPPSQHAILDPYYHGKTANSR